MKVCDWYGILDQVIDEKIQKELKKLHVISISWKLEMIR